jgi:nitrous-oxide reductase
MSENENLKGVSRRTLLGTTAVAAGVGIAGGAALTAAEAQTKAPTAPAARPAVMKA